MSVGVAINGFGRIGRLALRAAWDWPELAFVHVNELQGDAQTAAHLLTFDSIHGRFSEDVHGSVAPVVKVIHESIGPLAGILGYEPRPLVSVDFKDDPRSAIVDARSTIVTDGTHVKILAWHDNEWGYANRLVELARTVAASLPSKQPALAADADG